MTVSTFSASLDGYAEGVGGSYPPAASGSGSTNASINIHRSNVGTFVVVVGLFEFDTSSIPDTDVVRSAILRLYISAKTDTNNRSVSAGWYNVGGAISTADYTSTAETDAHTATDITGITTGGTVDFDLTDAVNQINKSGTTGLRVHITGGSPGGSNSITVAMTEHASQQEPQLIVTHGQDEEGAASLSGTASISAAGLRGKLGAAALSGVATVTAAGMLGRIASAALEGLATISAAASHGIVGAASLAGEATLTAAGSAGRNAASALSGIASLAGTALKYTAIAINIRAKRNEYTLTVDHANEPKYRLRIER